MEIIDITFKRIGWNMLVALIVMLFWESGHETIAIGIFTLLLSLIVDRQMLQMGLIEGKKF